MEKAGELLEAAELVVSAKSPIVSSHLYSQVCYDVRYTLNHLPLADAFMRRGELLPLLLRCLSLCQGLYPIRKRTQMHVVREENTWADAFSLGTEMSQLFQHVVAGIAAPETDPDASAKIGLALSLPCATPARAQVAARYVAAVTHTTRTLRAWLLCHRAARLGRDGTRGLFTFHLPLHRLLGGAGRDSLPAYASLLKYRDPERVAARVKQALEQGYRHIKLHETEVQSQKATEDRFEPLETQCV